MGMLTHIKPIFDWMEITCRHFLLSFFFLKDCHSRALKGDGEGAVSSF